MMNGSMHRLNVGGIECAPNVIYEHNTSITALHWDSPKFKLPATSYSLVDFLRSKRFFLVQLGAPDFLSFIVSLFFLYQWKTNNIVYLNM